VKAKTILEPSYYKWVIVAACLVIIVAGLKTVAPTLNIVLISIMIAQCMHPFARLLMKRRIPAGVAIGILIVVVFVLGVLITSLLGNTISGIREEAPKYSVRIDSLTTGLRQQLAAKGIDIDNTLPKGATDPAEIKDKILQVLSGVASMLGNSIFILILVIVFLAQFTQIAQKVRDKVYPENSFMYHVADMNAASSKFIGITALVGIMQAVVSTVVLLLFGVNFALTWGLLFFICNFIPVVGFLLALLPTVAIAYFDQGPTVALWVFVSWYLINIIFDNVVKPRFLKKEFDISFLSVLLLLIFWSYVLGPLGAILAIPISLSLKIIFETLEGKEKLN